MVVYSVWRRVQTFNQPELDKYSKYARNTIIDHGGKILTAYGKQEVIEGPPVEGVVVVEFPTMEIAKQWYNSPEYQAILANRKRGAEYHGVFVESTQ